MDASETSQLAVYQLHVSLRGVSPAIWRRVLMHSNSTITDLHYAIQLAMGWSDWHLNRFLIHGKEYGVGHDGGPLSAETIGLTLAESKAVLQRIQHTLVVQQARDHVDRQRIRARCGAIRSCKGHHSIVLRTLFGKLSLPSPRLYRCECEETCSLLKVILGASRD